MEVRFVQIMQGYVTTVNVEYKRVFGLDKEGRVWIFCPHECTWGLMEMEAEEVITPLTPGLTPK